MATESFTKNEFQIGDKVYLKTDSEQNLHIVIAYIIFNEDMMYRLVCNNNITEHFPFEISGEKNATL